MTGDLALEHAPRPVERPAPASQSRRLPGLDGLKGVAIVLVVVIHAAPSGAPLWHDWVVQGMARLAVPAFLGVSGFLHARKETSRRHLLSHALIFLRLHLVWALIYAGADLVDPQTPFSWEPRSLALHFGAGAWPGQFFLVVLAQILFIAWACGSARRWASLPGVALATSAWLAGVLLVLTSYQDLPRWEWVDLAARAKANPAWLWFVYFALGGVAGRTLPTRVDRRAGITGAFGVLAVILAASDIPPTAGVSWSAEFPYLRVSVLLGATALTLGLPAAATLPAPALLCALGRRSFALYVLNPLLLRILRALWGPPDQLAASLVHVGITLVVATALAELLQRRARWLLP